MSSNNNFPTWEELQTAYKEFGYTDTVIIRDRTSYNTFVKKYCAPLADEFNLSTVQKAIDIAKRDFENGEISRKLYVRLRRISAKIVCYMTKGRLEWMHLGPIDKKYANEKHEELLRLFLLQEEGRHAPSINYRSKNIVRQFLLYIEEEKHLDIDELNEQDVLDYLKYMHTRRKSGIKQIISSMRYFFDYLIEKGVIRKHLRSVLQYWGTPHTKTYRVLSTEEREKILSVIDTSTAIGKRDYAIYSLASDCGLRCSDIALLKLTNIYWKEASIFVTQSKTGKPVKLPFSSRTGDALADYILNARQNTGLPYVFTKERFCDTPITPALMNRHLKAYAVSAGISITDNESISMHTFRRSLGTDLIDSGHTLELVAQILGHDGITTAQRYISYTNDALLDCALDLSIFSDVTKEDIEC